VTLGAHCRRWQESPAAETHFYPYEILKSRDWRIIDILDLVRILSILPA
jgi:hypothetical protein